MSDALFDEGNDGWDAVGSQPVQMQAQGESIDDAFGDAQFEVAAPVTIITASGAAQNLDDDLTEEEKEICARAAEHQDQLKQDVHNRMMAEAGAKQERKSAGLAAVNQWHTER